MADHEIDCTGWSWWKRSLAIAWACIRHPRATTWLVRWGDEPLPRGVMRLTGEPDVVEGFARQLAALDVIADHAIRVRADPSIPRLCRWPLGHGSGDWRYAVYVPGRDYHLVIARAVPSVFEGVPNRPGIEWLDGREPPGPTGSRGGGGS